MQRLLVALGLLLVAAGVLWPWLSKLPSKADDSWVQIACDPQLDLGSPSCCSVKGSYCSATW